MRLILVSTNSNATIEGDQEFFDELTGKSLGAGPIHKLGSGLYRTSGHVKLSSGSASVYDPNDPEYPPPPPYPQSVTEALWKAAAAMAVAKK